MSLLRAKCPTCLAYTAVAIGPGLRVPLVRPDLRRGARAVPRAWGDGGEPMVEAASLPLDYPEAAVVEEDTLHAQTLSVASDLPQRPLILGGCCCSHIGAVKGLALRYDRLGVIWIDAHGDLNSPRPRRRGTRGDAARMRSNGAIELNGVAIDANKQAFEWGRRAGHDPAASRRWLALTSRPTSRRRSTR